MRLGFEIRIEKLEVVECVSLWSVLHRWLAKLRRLLQREEEVR